MRIQSPARSLSSLLLSAAILSGIAVTGCSLGNSGPSFAFTVHRSKVSVAGGTPIAISARFFAFLADEATSGAGGTDMNGDGDKIDSIAVLVNGNTSVETKLNVAAKALAWAEDELYLIVDEALDGRNWEPVDTGNKTVLLHVGGTTPTQTPDFIDVLDDTVATNVISYRSFLFFSRARQATNPLESNLAVISGGAPLTVTDVPTLDATGPLSPRILTKDEGLLFLGLDETVEGRDLNGDGDATDRNVLALLDGTFATGAIHSTGLAIPFGEAPVVRARHTSTLHDWQVGFLVSEADQDATNLNDPALFSGTWKPSQCAGQEDTDATDWVLHFLHFLPWDADDATNPPVNTGLVGSRKIAIANNFVATITPEHDAGENGGLDAEGNCDLNGDGDNDDYVVRWVLMPAAPGGAILPVTPAANIHALSDVPGGTHGLAEVGTRFVIQVSEPQDNLDINGDAQKNNNYIGWLQPSGQGNTNTPFDFVHGSTGNIVLGSTWMRETPARSRLGIGLFEKSYGVVNTTPGVNLNTHQPPLAGEDTDTNDSIAVFPSFVGSPGFLDLPGVAIAVQSGNAGMAIAKSDVFYRVSETEDSRDWNGDGLETGYVLFATSLSTQQSLSLGALNSLAQRQAVEVNEDETSPTIGVYLADEQLQGATGTDFNLDGDKSDLVISWILF
jgi:hypothetical protein